MMRNAVYGGIIFLVSSTINADPCRNVDGGSCWHVVNNAQTDASINCDGYGINGMFKKNSLSPGEIFSEQYSKGWGDGLGFPEPNISFTCTVAVNQKNAQLQFRTIDWGDRVKFIIENDKVKVELRAYWSRNHQEHEEPLR